MPSPRPRAAKQPSIRRPKVAGRTGVGGDKAAAREDGSATPDTAAPTTTTTRPAPEVGDGLDAQTERVQRPTESVPSPTKKSRLGGKKPSPSPAPESDADAAGSRAADSGAEAAADTAGYTATKQAEKRNGTGGSQLWRNPLVAIGAVIVVFTALAGWFGVESYQLNNDSSSSNIALVDSEATSSVIGQVTSAVQTVFSYNYTDTAHTEQAAQGVLAGNAIQQYNQLYAEVKKQAPVQKLVLTTTVQSVGVKVLTADRAELLVFVDQHAVRTDNSQNSSGPAQLSVNAQRFNGVWKITNMTVL